MAKRKRINVKTATKQEYVQRGPKKRILVKEITTQDRIDNAEKAKDKKFADLKARISNEFQKL